MNWHDRYKAMKKGLKLTNDQIGKIIGNTGDSVKSVTQPNKPLPRWLKLAIVVYEFKELEKNKILINQSLNKSILNYKPNKTKND